MGHMNYNRVSSGRVSSGYGHGSCRGFRLSPRRRCVLGLCKRFNFFIRLFDKWKRSCGEALQLLTKVFFRQGGFKRNNSNYSSRRSLVREEQIKCQVDCRMRSYGRSNSFYAEAIADCLEFIKRTSISSMDPIQDPINHIQDRRNR